MLTSIDVQFIFDSACLLARLGHKGCLVVCKYSPNNRCRPSSCLLDVLSMFLANSSPISSSRNEGNFVLTTETTTSASSALC